MKHGKIYRADYSTATDARVHQTRAAIRKAFLHLLDQKPLEQITVREITSAAGIGYTTFFVTIPARKICSMKSRHPKSSI